MRKHRLLSTSLHVVATVTPSPYSGSTRRKAGSQTCPSCEPLLLVTPVTPVWSDPLSPCSPFLCATHKGAVQTQPTSSPGHPLAGWHGLFHPQKSSPEALYLLLTGGTDFSSPLNLLNEAILSAFQSLFSKVGLVFFLRRNCKLPTVIHCLQPCFICCFICWLL